MPGTALHSCMQQLDSCAKSGAARSSSSAHSHCIEYALMSLMSISAATFHKVVPLQPEV
jgi:hypothetical protein